MASLFSEEFVQVISRLRIVARNVPRGGRHAEQRSIQLGTGMEFRDFRPYQPGDDFRRIDWNFYRRSGKLFLRMFEELQELPVYVLLDASDSMYFETPPRVDAARRMAAAIVAAALNQHDSPSVYPFGRDLAVPLRSISGRTGLSRALGYLGDLSPAGPTDIPSAIGRFSRLALRRGLVVVISDFFDPRGIDVVVEALRALRHRILLVQVTRASDADPELTGQVRLIDCEDGRDVDVTITPQALALYRRAYAAFMDGLVRFVTERRTGYLALDADRPVLEQISRIFVNGVFRAGE